MWQRDLLHKRLEVAEGMRAFISHRMSHAEELRVKLEQVEGELAAAQKVAAEGVEALRRAEEERDALQMEDERLRKESEEAERLRKERESMEAKFQESEQENVHLKKEIEELWSGFDAHKKELEGEYQK